MKAIRPLRLGLLMAATCAAGMLWLPLLVGVALGGPILISDLGRVWWSIQLLCSILTLALTAVAVMRCDFLSIYGFAASLSVYFGAPILWLVISQLF